MPVSYSKASNFKIRFVGVSALGPITMHYVTPDPDELFKIDKIQKFNPDLQRRSLENRERITQEWNDYILKLQELSKSDKSIWIAWKEDEARRAKEEAEEAAKRLTQLQQQQQQQELDTAS
ncbi:MAG: hypothetical protein Q9190_004232 [Brigantiaea leucoxantha]